MMMLRAMDLLPILQLTTRGRSCLTSLLRSLYCIVNDTFAFKPSEPNADARNLTDFSFPLVTLCDSVIRIKPNQNQNIPLKLDYGYAVKGTWWRLTSSSNVSTLQSFPVRSLGWMEMAEQDLSEGRSSVAVHHCIRQLSYCRRDIRDSAGVWGEVSVAAETASNLPSAAYT